MAEIHNATLERVYRAASVEESRAAYDDWASHYESDVLAYGYRVAVVAATVWSRFVAAPGGPILDAGCGTGLQVEPLRLAGFTPITGIDLSDGMLAIARQKGIYDELRQMALGGALDFDDNQFANTLSVGTITPGHAPPAAFEELIRVTEPGGCLVFSMRVDDAQDPAYLDAIADHASSGRWTPVFATEPFAAMPIGEPDVFNRIFVVRIT